MAPNPKSEDEMWIGREGETETALYVPPNGRKRFEELFEGHAKSLGMTGSVEFLPYVWICRSTQFLFSFLSDAGCHSFVGGCLVWIERRAEAPLKR